MQAKPRQRIDSRTPRRQQAVNEPCAAAVRCAVLRLVNPASRSAHCTVARPIRTAYIKSGSNSHLINDAAMSVQTSAV